MYRIQNYNNYRRYFCLAAKLWQFSLDLGEQGSDYLCFGSSFQAPENDEQWGERIGVTKAALSIIKVR